MTRTTNRADTVPRSSLPEHLRSAAVGAVVAEALEAAVTRDQAHTGAVGDLIGHAAEEIRAFHGRPAELTPPAGSHTNPVVHGPSGGDE